MKKNKLKKALLALCIMCGSFSYGQTWEVIATDASGDGASGVLLDGTELAYWYNESEDSLWFLLTCSGISPSQSTDLGFNVMVNYPGGGSTFNFWGGDNTNAYHKLLTGWVTGAPPSSYSGTIGIANDIGVLGWDFTNLFSDNLTVIVDVAAGTITVGMNREDLIPDAALDMEIDVAAAVGSSSSWNDDIHTPSGTMILNTTDVGAGLVRYEKVSTIDVFPNPAHDLITFSLPSETENMQLRITDLSGREWLNTNVSDKTISVQDLPQGIYCLHINSEKGDYTAIAKFVKQ